ncbi:hypothetical protein HDU87_000571 [Geranomyces variabilis]|uniref:Uncharacterized protein n=1 Tax=Geranomyces variabilis TaxID=109894 RepID=A0AAD5XJE7_9FUNG|nr:hypothetical protein HDU87_000571 [Geranomyces variabilis]
MDELFAKRVALVDQIKTEAQNYEVYTHRLRLAESSLPKVSRKHALFSGWPNGVQRGQQVCMERVLACARRRVLLKYALRDRLTTADAVPITPFERVATPSVHHERAHPTPEQSVQKKCRR